MDDRSDERLIGKQAQRVGKQTVPHYSSFPHRFSMEVSSKILGWHLPSVFVPPSLGQHETMVSSPVCSGPCWPCRQPASKRVSPENSS